MRDHRLAARFLLTASLLLPCIGAVAAGPGGSFFRLLGSTTSNNEGLTVEQTSDGGYIMVGNTSAANNATLVVKYDAAGRATWQNAYSLDGHFAYSAAVHQTSTGYIAVIDMGGLPNTIGVFALDASGKTLWQNHYVTQITTGMAYLNIEPTADGGYVLGADNSNFYSNQYAPAWALKLDGSGNVLWQQVFDFDVGSIHATADSGAIVTGYDLCPWSCTGTGYVVKLDAAGVVSWEKQYQHGAGGLYLTSGRPQADGSYLVSGSYYAGSYEQALLMKLTSTGDVSSLYGYGVSGCYNMGGTDAQPGPGGGYYLMLSDSCSVAVGMVARLDSTGAILWQQGFSPVSGKPPISGVTWSSTHDGGLVSTGNMGNGIKTPAKVTLIKLNARGGTLSACTNLQMTSPQIAPVTPAAVTASDVDVASTITAISAGAASVTTTAMQLQPSSVCQK